MRFLPVCVLLIFSIPTGLIHAQFSGEITGNTLSIGLDPQYPGPGDTVTATLDDYSLNTNGATVGWFINHKFVADSKNKRNITFTAGAVGSATDVEARLTFTNGQTMSAKHSFKPFYVDIIVEPQTYTPIFYKGRSLPIYGSTVYLTALISKADGLVNAANYTYKWSLNDKVLNGGSIRGANKTQIIIPYGLNSIVALSVFDSIGQMIARRLIEIPSVDIDLKFYEMSTLYGLSHRVLDDPFNLVSNSTTIRVVPYNLDLFSIKKNLYTNWQINGIDQTDTGSDPFEITIKNQAGGSSQITFKVRNLNELLQGGQASVQIQS